MTTEDKARFLDACPHLLDDVHVIDRALGRKPQRDWNAVWSRVEDVLHKRKSRWKGTEQKLFRSVFAQKDPEAEPVLLPSTSGRGAGGVGAPHPFEPDSDLRDFENVPLKDDIDAYFKREVRPHVPDAWMDRSKDKLGYEINFNQPQASLVPDHKVERWCSQVAAELLVPEDVFRAEYNRSAEPRAEANRLAKRFKVSTLVILRRMNDAGGLSSDKFWRLYDAELEFLRAIPKGSGGDFYLTLGARASKRFARALVIAPWRADPLLRKRSGSSVSRRWRRSVIYCAIASRLTDCGERGKVISTYRLPKRCGMATTVRISSKHQIVIPREARETLHIGPGEVLMVLVKENRIVLVPRPSNFVARMAGLHKDVWDGTQGTSLLADERKSWDR